MTLVQAVLLGAVQGATEFLPVSSSGHLALLENVWGIKAPGLNFEVMLHLGSLVAVVVFFRRDLWTILAALFEPDRLGRREARAMKQMAWAVLVACVPTAVAGLVLRSWVEKAFGSISWTGIGFLAGGAIMMLAGRNRRRHGKSTPTPSDALGIGILQSVALFPGVSRSGTTISASLLSGLSREAAARFSFILSVPVIGGAAVLDMLHLLKGRGHEGVSIAATAVGFAVSALVSYVSIATLMAWLRKRDLRLFAMYCFIIGLAALWLGR